MNLPLPNKTPKKNVQCEIDRVLYLAVRAEGKKLRLPMTKVLEWGMKAFLAQTNPSAAAKLGIQTSKE